VEGPWRGCFATSAVSERVRYELDWSSACGFGPFAYHRGGRDRGKLPGAGTILRCGRERSVEGLTTAASLLLAAAVGICVALSRWVIAIGATVLVLIVLRAVSRIERWFVERRRQIEELSLTMHGLVVNRSECMWS
jgi:hypothetical protein